MERKKPRKIRRKTQTDFRQKNHRLKTPKNGLSKVRKWRSRKKILAESPPKKSPQFSAKQKKQKKKKRKKAPKKKKVAKPRTNKKYRTGNRAKKAPKTKK